MPREAIVARLWGQNVFVDVEMGINTAIRKIRQALNDSRDRRKSAGTGGDSVRGRAIASWRMSSSCRRTAAGAAVMLAVLPFVNLTGDAQREYVADGLTEDAIATLGQIDPVHMRVIGRTSAMTYKDTPKSMATIGSELNAQFLIEGSLRSEGPGCASAARSIASRIRPRCGRRHTTGP